MGFSIDSLTTRLMTLDDLEYDTIRYDIGV